MRHVPDRIRRRWALARRLRRGKRRLENALYTRDTGYGRGRRYPSLPDGVYNRVSEALGIIEGEIRELEGTCD